MAEGTGFYVSVVDGDRRALLVGPFKRLDHAASCVSWVQYEAAKVDARAPFYAFGTAKKTGADFHLHGGLGAGAFNDRFGFRSDLSGWVQLPVGVIVMGADEVAQATGVPVDEVLAAV